MDVIIPNLVCVLFDPAIPTSSFNLFFILVYRCMHKARGWQIHMYMQVLLFSSLLQYQLELSRAQSPRCVAWYQLHKQATIIQCYSSLILSPLSTFPLFNVACRKGSKELGIRLLTVRARNSHSSFVQGSTAHSNNNPGVLQLLQNILKHYGAKYWPKQYCMSTASLAHLGPSTACMYAYKLSQPESQRVP